MKLVSRSIALVAVASAALSALATERGQSDVALKQTDTAIEVTVGGKPFTTYRFAPAADDPKFVRPYFYPVLADDGTALTSDQATSGGDHPHHRSLYVAHGDVNGADHWSLMLGDKQPRQRHLGFDKLDGDTIVQRLAWDGTDGAPLLNETRTLRFFAEPDGSRGVDLTVALTPADESPVTLGDTKEAGLCAVRVAKSMSDAGTITTSEGLGGEAAWGKPAAWCDFSGPADGKPHGVAIFDHPANPRHPTRWHVRTYGLMTANPFGLSDFDKSPKGTGSLDLLPGTTTTFRYRVLFHPGDVKAARIAERYATFAKEAKEPV
jgi:hypothetical protein